MRQTKKCPYCKKTKIKKNDKRIFTLECQYCGYPDIDGLLKRLESDLKETVK